MDKQKLLEQINHEYASICQQLGDLHYKNRQIQAKIAELEEAVFSNDDKINDLELKIDSLNEKAAALHKPSPAAEDKEASNV